MSRREIIVDDLTGRESDKTESVPVTWNGKKYTMDLCPDSVLALEALFTGNGPGMLTELLAPAPAPAPAGKRNRTASDNGNSGENKLIREWWGTPDGRTATGTPEDQPIPNRGRIPAEVTDAYRKAQA